MLLLLWRGQTRIVFYCSELPGNRLCSHFDVTTAPLRYNQPTVWVSGGQKVECRSRRAAAPAAQDAIDITTQEVASAALSSRYSEWSPLVSEPVRLVGKLPALFTCKSRILESGRTENDDGRPATQPGRSTNKWRSLQRGLNMESVLFSNVSHVNGIMGYKPRPLLLANSKLWLFVKTTQCFLRIDAVRRRCR